jgi:hypothetical protein
MTERRRPLPETSSALETLVVPTGFSAAFSPAKTEILRGHVPPWVPPFGVDLIHGEACQA